MQGVKAHLGALTPQNLQLGEFGTICCQHLPGKSWSGVYVSVFGVEYSITME